MDLQRTDCMVVMGSNFAENHPVGFRFVMKAKERGGKIVHVDPRFTRTSAMADIYAPIRSGSDIVFLGALINYVINSDRLNSDPFFKEYVVNYTNAATLVNTKFGEHDVNADGLFTGWDAQGRRYDVSSWQYQKEDTGPEGQGQPQAEATGATLSESYSQRLGQILGGPPKTDPS